MENYAFKFELKSPSTSQESSFNTLVLLLKELQDNLYENYNDYVVNDILNRIQLQAENMKINIIDINKGCQCEGAK